MPSRRVFLQTSVATLSAIAADRSSFAGLPLPESPSPIRTVVFDERIELSRQYAADAQAAGADALAFRGDIGALWYDGLRDRMQSSPIIIAGLTLEPAAIEMRSYARDVEYREIVRSNADHSLVSWVLAPLYK